MAPRKKQKVRAVNPGPPPEFRKKLDIDRDAYCVPPTTYIRDGKVIDRDGYCVPETSYQVEDKGSPGRKSRGAKKGPYSRDKKDPKTGDLYETWIKRPGKLGGPGYTKRSTAERHKILKKCIEGGSLKLDGKKWSSPAYGYRSCRDSLTVLLRSSEIKGKTRKTIQEDVKWIEKTYGEREGNPMDLDNYTFHGIIGDNNPIEHGGGVVFTHNDYPDRPQVLYFQPYGGDDDGGMVTVSSFDVEEDVTRDLLWADWSEIAESIGIGSNELNKHGRSRDPVARAQVYETVGNYHGFIELDHYPREMRIHDAEKEYEEFVDAAHIRAEKPKKKKNPGKSKAKKNPHNDEPGIWVGSWAAYNEGNLRGDWIHFSDTDELDEGLKKLYKRYPRDEEWGVFDHDNMIGFNSEDIHSAREWSKNWDELREKFNLLDDEERQAMVTYIQDTQANLDDAEEAWSGIKAEGYNRERDLAYAVVDSIGDLENTLSTEQIAGYFDYQSFARDLELGGDIVTMRHNGDLLIAWSGDLEDSSEEDPDDEAWQSGFDTKQEFAENLLDDIGISDAQAEQYFNWDAFGRDLAIGDYTEYGGYWFRNI